MGKYFSAKIANHYLYYTSFDKDEPIHAHASDRHLMEAGSAKIWVMKDGSTEVATRGYHYFRKTKCRLLERGKKVKKMTIDIMNTGRQYRTIYGSSFNLKRNKNICYTN